MKWLFLLRQESNLKNDSSFYDFVPYKYGPFSFTIYKDISELKRLGYLTAEETINSLCKTKVEAMTSEISTEIQSDIIATIDQYRNLSQKELVNLVYVNYPWFASRSEINNMKNPLQKIIANPAIYTLGYEGKSIDNFMQQLIKKGIRALIDVRNNPLSRKYGFSKSSLSKICNDLDIEYFHYPELGIPSSYRTQLNSFDDYNKLFKFYVSNILSETYSSQQKVIRVMEGKPAALVCFEENPCFCHRSHLAVSLANISKLELVHL